MLALRLVLVTAACAFAATAAFSGSDAPLVIDPTNSLWILHPDDVGFGARPPMMLALRDVQADWYKVLGRRPSVFKGDACPPDFSGTCLFFGRAATAHKLPARPSRGDPHPEAHSIVVSGNHVYMTGNSLRAEVYAAYAFSERVLGVEPLWWWTDAEPIYRGTLSFAAPTVEVAADYGAPAFERRGWFPNDEDLLGNFAPDPLAQSVFSADTWNRIAEALLRLKGNMIIPGTVAFPDEAVYEVMRRRGVIVTQHHFTLLGINTWRWPRGVPYSFNENPEMQDWVWQTSVDAYAGREAVWAVGYRGLNDYPFWTDEPSFNTTAARCALISEAMRRQAEIVRAAPGRQDDALVTYLWAEMFDLLASGKLEIPRNTTRVFADSSGRGVFDPKVLAMLKPGDGAYYHVQMEFPGYMNQLTEMVPPASFFGQLSHFVAARATSFFVLNVSDLRPATFGIDTVMRYLWDPSVADGAASPEAAQDAAIASWCERHFEPAFAERAADVMRGYFNVSYILGRDEQRFGDEHLSGLVRKLLPGNPNLEKTRREALAFVQEPLGQLGPLHALAQALLANMTAAGARGAPTFQGSFSLHVATHWFGCRAVDHAARGDFAAARTELASLRAQQRGAEQVRWRGLYGADRLVDWANLDCLLEAAAAQDATAAAGPTDGATAAAGPTDGETLRASPPPTCNGPNGAAYRAGTGQWSDWFQYANTTANFPFLNDAGDASKSMDLVVRITCDENVAGDACRNTPVGGTFETTATIVMTTPRSSGTTIRFTLDGSEPTEESEAYRGPLIISNTTRIAAKAFSEGGNSLYPELVTRPVFTRGVL
jgi:hypothetical protein